ncbi:transcriptional regulator, partial [Cupriavidus gilardii]|uniref:transcriptional regulator n=1 Tax=Cupriavidus gilardii TaxID=82541 RepID=UPI0021C08E61
MKEHPIDMAARIVGSQVALAVHLSVTKAAVNQWKQPGRKVPAEHCPAIERLTCHPRRVYSTKRSFVFHNSFSLRSNQESQMARRAEFRNEVKTRLRDRAYEARWAAGSSRAPTSAATRWCRSWSSASSMPTRRRRPPSGTTSAVIREFLVALGFKVDEKGLKNFNAGVEQATKGVIRLVSTIQ